MRPAHYESSTRNELTERQREILALMAAGRTNGEIAGALGMSLDGAKWHVSEILRKLDVDSREEAIERWRAERGLKARFLRAVSLPGWAVLRWVAGGTAAAAGIGVALVVVPLFDGEPGSDPPAAAAPHALDHRVETGKRLAYVVDAVTYEPDATRIAYHLEGDLDGLAFLGGDRDDPSFVPPLDILGGETRGEVTIPGRPPGGVLRFPSAYRAVDALLTVTLPVDPAPRVTIATPHGAITAGWVKGDSAEGQLILELTGDDVIATLAPGSRAKVALVDDLGNAYPLVHGSITTPARGDGPRTVRAYLAFEGALPDDATEVTLSFAAYEELIIGDWTVTIAAPD